MGGKGGGGGTQTVTERSDPWAGQAPYLAGLYRAADALQLQQPYPYPAVVPPSPRSAEAELAMTERAMQGSPVQASGLAQNLATTRGDYLYGGPAFGAAFQAAQDVISPAVQGQFTAGGRYGGGLAQAEETRHLANAFAGLYDQERGRQMQAAAIAPMMAQTEYDDIVRLAGVGATQEARGREALADAMSRWQFQQRAPYDRLAFQSQIIQGGYPGGLSEMQQPNQQMSPLAGALGGGMLGYWAGGPSGLTGLGLSPWGGAAIGAGLGLLGSK